MNQHVNIDISHAGSRAI